MRPRRQAAQHVKLNILAKSQLINLKKDGNSSSLRNRDSFNRTFTLSENDKTSESKSLQQSRNSSASQGISEYSPIENVQVSQFTYSKLSLVEKHLFFSMITMFFFGFLLVEVESEPDQSESQDYLLLLLSFSSLLQVILTILRKLLVIQLKIDQKVMYHYSNSKITTYLGPAFAALISNQYLLLELGLEIVIALVHPNIVTKGMTYTLYDQEYDMELTLSINDLLGVLMLVKLGIIIRSLVNLTKFVTPRVVRVCNLNQVDYNVMYSIKCIQKQYPIRFVLIAVSLILSTFSYGFRFSEGTVINYNHTTKNGFQSLPNCLWFAFQTMYTIGYADYIPRTIIARFLAACLSVMGVGINSMLLVNVFEYISMSNQQQKSLTLINRMNNRIQMQRHASYAIAHLAQITELLKTSKPMADKLQVLDSYYKNVKLHMDQSKQYRLNIKNLIPLNDQTQTMIHQFSILRQNFSEVCRNQISVLSLLQSDKQSNIRIKRSIGEHFKSFIRKTLTRSPSMSVAQG